MHQLKLDIKDSLRDNHSLIVTDFSEWDPMLNVKHRILQILPPQGDCYITVPFPNDKPVAISSVHLDLSKEPDDLPDGLYQLHYSVSPNSNVFVEYGHFRVARVMNLVYTQMASLHTCSNMTLDQCGNIVLDKMQNTLLHIWMLLNGAQAVGKETANHEHAQHLYRMAYDEFNRLTNRC